MAAAFTVIEKRGVLFWQETRQQLRFAGRIAPVDPALSDEIWFDRPVASQASAVASQQSAPITDEVAFRAHAAELARATTPFDRPADWGGFRLVPDEVEFWHGQPNRLHRRLRYTRTGSTWPPSPPPTVCPPVGWAANERR